MEARPPALRAKGCLGPPTVILAGNGPVQLSATHTSAPSRWRTCRNSRASPSAENMIGTTENVQVQDGPLHPPAATLSRESGEVGSRFVEYLSP